MIIQVSAQSPALVHAAAALILTAHIGGGVVGLVSGAAALLARKGGRLHGWAGNTFVLSMLVMAVIGGGAAPLLPQRSSVPPAILTFYLVITGWLTVNRPSRTIGSPELIALLIAVGGAGLGVSFAVQAARASHGLDGDGPAMFYVFAGLLAFAAALDISMIMRGGLVGAPRLARHLWRMCAALLIAAASFFLGQQKVFPASLRGSPVLLLPELAILGLMIFWLVRARFATVSRAGAGEYRSRRGRPASLA
jgi:hypothetical protein